MTLYEMEPWADERMDLAVGTAIAWNAECHGLASKPPVEYMHYLKKDEPEVSERDLVQARARWAEGINRAVEGK